jgi:hypothetical protein
MLFFNNITQFQEPDSGHYSTMGKASAIDPRYGAGRATLDRYWLGFSHRLDAIQEKNDATRVHLWASNTRKPFSGEQASTGATEALEKKLLPTKHFGI